MIPSHVRNAQPRSAVGLEPFTSGVDQAEALPDALSALQPEKLHPETHPENGDSVLHYASLQRIYQSTVRELLDAMIVCANPWQYQLVHLQQRLRRTHQVVFHAHSPQHVSQRTEVGDAVID